MPCEEGLKKVVIFSLKKGRKMVPNSSDTVKLKWNWTYHYVMWS